MGHIRVLPDHLANQIAAGEVVERPVSAVKELLENSLDAGADHIRLAIEAGGKRKIAIWDNGHGMDHDDCLMAFERHATSKLTRAEDLFSIRTLGFRGEALPSIASVSRMTLESRTPEATVGVRVTLRGSKIEQVTEVACPVGTHVNVGGLFFNIPARRKFMRRTETELSWIVNLVTQYSFAHLDKRFVLESDGRTLFDVTPVTSLKERIYQHFGKDMMRHMLDLDQHCDWLHLSGMISTPNYFKTSRSHQYLFVNGRLVRDKVLSHAISEAYRGFGEGHTHPVIFLFVHVPSAEVDVNVHPAKTEVKFIQGAWVHDRVRDVLRERLVAQPLTVTYRVRTPPVIARQTSLDDRTQNHGPLFTPNDDNPYQRFVARHEVDHTSQPSHIEEPVAAVADKPLFHAEPSLQNPRVIGQFRDSYILAQDREHLYVIDQHVAHERILYDQINATLLSGSFERQKLLIPETVEMTRAQMIDFESLEPLFTRFGFDVGALDDRTCVVREVPAFLTSRQVGPLVVELVEKARGQRDDAAVEAIIDLLAATRACKAAIKINMRLTAEKMQHLIDQLWSSSSPLFCPHGRPIALTMTNDEIERNFLRK
ncbi:MAG: DNA mismatch repair endonuclease MutL [Acidobacteria bacterium]|nr:DNA mismatch repair endonuclease MutL [Acidobacteriota bacterium]